MFQTPTREYQEVSPAILAPLPTVSDMETDPNIQTEHRPDPQPEQPDCRQEHDHLVTSSLTSSMTNFSQELLTPWSCQGSKIFLDICSGVDAPLSSAVSKLGFPALSIDLLVDSRMDLLDDSFYEQLLRLCGSGVVGYSAASPSCTEYSLLKLRPGGPKAIRTPDMLSGVPNLTPEETQRLQDSATLLYRCVNSVSVTYSSGGHGHIEQPSGAMSWSEDCTQEWIRLSGCALILLAACAFHWNIMKTWLFASSFQPLAELAATCNHGPNAHPSIAGVKDEHGVYLSRRSAAYPKALAEPLRQKFQCSLLPWLHQFHGPMFSIYFPSSNCFKTPKVLWMGEACIPHQIGPNHPTTPLTCLDQYVTTGSLVSLITIGIRCLFPIFYKRKQIPLSQKGSSMNSAILLTLCCRCHHHWIGKFGRTSPCASTLFQQ